jgi:hypothetical protein
MRTLSGRGLSVYMKFRLYEVRRVEELGTMRGDDRVLDYLNRSLRSELTAINQYWLHYRIFDNWGFKGETMRNLTDTRDRG